MTRGVRCLEQVRARWGLHGVRRFESVPTSSLRQPHHAVARSQHPDREFPHGFCCKSVVGGCSRSGRWHRARTWLGRHQMGSGRHQARPRYDRPSVRRQPADCLCERPKDRRHAGRRECSLRDDFCRLPVGLYGDSEICSSPESFMWSLRSIPRRKRSTQGSTVSSWRVSRAPASGANRKWPQWCCSLHCAEG